MTFEIINPEALGRPKGWSNGMLAPKGGRLLFVAGQTAPDADGFVGQFGAALDRILLIVREAGGKPGDIGRLTIFVSSRQAYLDNLTSLGEAYRKRMEEHYPAMALVEVKALLDARAMVEIEATAVIP